MCSISSVGLLDTREVEFVFVSQLDVNEEDAKQLEYRSRVFRRWETTVSGMFASMVSFECLMFFCSKEITWRSEASGTSAWKIMCLGASRVRQADAMN